MCRIQGCRGLTILYTDFFNQTSFSFLIKIPTYGSDHTQFLFKKMDLFLLALGLRSCVQTFSSCGERGLLSSCGAWTSGYSGFSCWGALAELTHGMWDLPGPGAKPVSPALTGGFFLPGPHFALPQGILNHWEDLSCLLCIRWFEASDVAVFH